MNNNVRGICIDDERDDLFLLNEYIRAEPLFTSAGIFLPAPIMYFPLEKPIAVR